MTVLLPYALKVLVLSALLFAYYWLALRNRLFHQWNRFYLLFATAASMALPLVDVSFFTQTDDDSEIYQLLLSLQGSHRYLDEIVIGSGQPQSFDAWWQLCYGVVCGLLFFGFAVSLYRIFRLVKLHKVEPLEGVNFVRTTEPSAPFTFWNFIFWNTKIDLDTTEGKQILRHELVHVHQRHSMDKIFLQTVLILFWWNPVFWLIRKELSYIHEFIADKKSVGSGGAAAFAAMVLNAAFPGKYAGLTHPFFQTSIKRRMQMLTKNNNPRFAYIGRLTVLPLMALALIAFARNEQNTEKRQLIQELKELQAGLSANSVPLVDTPPARKEIKSVNVIKSKDLLEIEFADGTKKTMSRTEAREQGFFNEGAILESGNGSVTLSSSRIVIRDLKDPNKPQPIYLLDGEEISDISSVSPDTIQSVNVLKGEAATKLYGAKGANGVVVITSKKDKPQPLYVVDGKIVTDISTITPATIESINVLKEAPALEKYGAKGMNGVIEIRLKKDGASRNSQIVQDTTLVQDMLDGLFKKSSVETNADSVVIVKGRPLKRNADQQTTAPMKQN